MKRLKDESGQALVISALAMTCLFGFVALATDVGIMMREKRMTQTAADGAAVAGASELAFGGAQVSNVAKSAAGLNGYADGVNGVTVTVNGPPGGPASGPHAGDAKYVEVVVSKVQPTLFMGMFGVFNLTPTARAVATQGVTNGCIVTLGTDPTTPDITIIGSADITVKTCGIADNSPSPGGSKNSALYLQGKATLDAASIGIVGGVGTTGNVNLTPATPATGMVPVSDPLAAKLGTAPPPTGCINVPAGATEIGPGCYNGISVGSNNTLKLDAGQYVINGDITLSGTSTLDGSAGVELVLYGGINTGGTTNMILNPSSTGGVVLWEPAPNASPLNLTGNPGSDLEGIVYAPDAPVALQGNAGATIRLNFAVSTLTLQGNATLLDYNQVNPNNLLTVARLVE